MRRTNRISQQRWRARHKVCMASKGCSEALAVYAAAPAACWQWPYTPCHCCRCDATHVSPGRASLSLVHLPTALFIRIRETSDEAVAAYRSLILQHSLALQERVQSSSQQLASLTQQMADMHLQQARRSCMLSTQLISLTSKSQADTTDPASLQKPISMASPCVRLMRPSSNQR